MSHNTKFKSFNTLKMSYTIHNLTSNADVWYATRGFHFSYCNLGEFFTVAIPHTTTVNVPKLDPPTFNGNVFTTPPTLYAYSPTPVGAPGRLPFTPTCTPGTTSPTDCGKCISSAQYAALQDNITYNQTGLYSNGDCYCLYQSSNQGQLDACKRICK